MSELRSVREKSNIKGFLRNLVGQNARPGTLPQKQLSERPAQQANSTLRQIALQRKQELKDDATSIFPGNSMFDMVETKKVKQNLENKQKMLNKTYQQQNVDKYNITQIFRSHQKPLAGINETLGKLRLLSQKIVQGSPPAHARIY